ncbi:hypothetical protein XPA_007292 [Xanthoria parietina]
MEAISIAASVVGILSITAKLATGLTELIERGKNVPGSIHSLVSELNDMRGCLAQLQPLLQDTQRSAPSRTAMLSLNQILTINTSCVLTLSELEKFVDSFKKRQSLSNLDRLRWLRNESRIERMLLRIRASRSSLNLILVILTCVSIQEARAAIETLVPTVESIRTSSQDVSRRLATLEQTANHAPSMTEVRETSHGDNEHVSEVASKAGSSQAHAGREGFSTTKDHAATPNSTSVDQPLPHDLELLLQCSRPYSRLQPGLQRLALSSASNHTGLDTLMTGISLSAVSNLSLVSLPISMHEIWDTSHYIVETDAPHSPAQDEDRSRSAFETRNPSLFSDLDKDDRNSSGSSKTLVNPGSDTLENSDVTKTLPLKQGLGIPKPRRKIVFHGTDESGMSTLIKQMQIAYAPETISAAELESIRFQLWSNLLNAFYITLIMIDENHWKYESDQVMAAADYFRRNHESWNDGCSWPVHRFHSSQAEDWPLPSAAPHCFSTPNVLLPFMETLWWDPSFQRALKRGHEYVQYDNIYYCFRHRKQLFLQRRDISMADFLRVRILTRNITEKFLETTKFVYHVIDVNGARFGRKQWPHTWEGTNCLFFVASLAGYNRCLIQDTDTNQMIESLELFEAVLPLISTSSIVLIFNKIDVFRQQIQEHPLKTWFPDFVGREKDPEAALLYIEARFKAAKSLYDEREIHVHYTDATNIEACQATLQDIEETVMPQKSVSCKGPAHGENFRH